jgi:DNA repair exonuclease SbcCD ATPase subunit
MTKFALRRLSAEGFRGIGEPLDLAVDPRVTLLLAPNGSGKTSVLGSIEWALFGELHDQPRENPTNDELVNVHHHPREARVTLELVSGDDTLVVERTKQMGKRASALSVTFSDVRRFQDREAEQFLFQHLGLTFEDFYRAVYLHQESIRGLLVDEPRVRNESLDRLFGVDTLRDILRVMSPKAVRDEIKAIEAAKDRATAKLQGSIDAVTDRCNRALTEAQRDGLHEDELNLAAGSGMLDDIAATLADAAALVGYTESVALETPGSWSDLDRLARRARELVKSVRQRGIDLQLSTGPAVEASAAVQARAALDNGAHALATAREALDEQVRAHGTEEQIVRRLAEARQAFTDLEEQSQRLGAHQRVVAETLRFLRTATDANTCPVCGQPIESHDLIVRLQEGLEEEDRRQIDALHDEQERVRTQTRLLETAAADLQRAQTTVERTQAQLDEARSAALRALGREVQPDEIDTALVTKIGELERDAAKTSQARGQAETLLSRVETDIDRVRVVYRCLQAEDERNQAMQRMGSLDSDQSQADAQMAALQDLEEWIETIAHAVQAVAGERARVALDAAHDRISAYYGDLCNHPYFDRLQIAVEEQRVMGTDRNNYVIRAYASSDGQATLASSRLSTAQMNCAALSVYLALASGLEHNLGFVLLDDPSQSLDAEHKRALARLLSQTSGDLQLLIATQDEEFGDMLRRQWLGDAATAYNLAWSARSGTAAILDG